MISWKKQFCVTMLFVLLSVLGFEMSAKQNVLIITSYNPEIQSTAQTLHDIVEENRRRGNFCDITVETINSYSYNEAKKWKSVMAGILEKYSSDATVPDAIIILGQEAWNSYLSQDNPMVKRIPTFCGMVSRNVILTPPDSVDLSTWSPESRDINEFNDFNIKGGIVYDYSFSKNIDLVKTLYPETENVIILSDNTFGGVNMQALIKSEAVNYPEYSFRYLDGRQKTLLQVCDSIREMPPRSVLICGTWRVDKEENSVLKSATYLLRDANSRLPALSMASVGVGHWVLGGYMPAYQPQGKLIACRCFDYLQTDGKKSNGLSALHNKYIFDYQRFAEYGIDKRLLPANAEIINQPLSVWKAHQNVFIAVTVVFIIIVILLMFLSDRLRRTRKYKAVLEQKNRELTVAKEKAEIAVEMKMKFIRNISHEVRTPLNAIIGFSQLFVADTTNPASLKKYAEAIDHNSYDLLKLVGDIVEISRLDSNDCDEPLRSTVMSDLIHSAYEQTAVKKQPGVEFIMLPIADDSPRLIKQHLVELVVVNYLHNAFKFTKKGTVTLECTVSPDEKTMSITVTDTGCGISPAKRDFIFERFAKLNEFSQGAGIGLSICQAVADELGGTVGLDQTYNDGCRFFFRFPI